ncbi:MAG: hypothetical protein ABJG15_07430 [Hyphomonadaceae bacterium]
MSYNGSNIAKVARRTRLENAQEFVAKMVAERDDGVAYLPIFVRLEKELAAMEAQEAAIQRAKSLARAKCFGKV